MYTEKGEGLEIHVFHSLDACPAVRAVGQLAPKRSERITLGLGRAVAAHAQVSARKDNMVRRRVEAYHARFGLDLFGLLGRRARGLGLRHDFPFGFGIGAVGVDA